VTTKEAIKRIEEIKAIAGDDERAHGEEDEFRGDVLRAIADGAPNTQELARLALTTGEIDFQRWCA
jgi:hypothetical protein